MQYTDGAGTAHELPKYTKALAKRIDQAGSEREREKGWRLKLAVVQECLGDAAPSVLDGSTLDDVDINALETEFAAIEAAYQAPRTDAQAERIDQILSSIDVEKIEAMARAIESLDSRQGFKNVK